METQTQLFAGAAGVLAFVGMRIASAAYNRIVPHTPKTAGQTEYLSDDEKLSLRSSTSSASLQREDVADLTKDLEPEFEEAEVQMTAISEQFEEISVKERATSAQRKASTRGKAVKDTDATAATPPARRTRKKPEIFSPVDDNSMVDPSTKRAPKRAALSKSPTAQVQQDSKQTDNAAAAPCSRRVRRNTNNKENETEMAADVIEVDLEPIVDMEVEMRQPSSAMKPKPSRKKAAAPAPEPEPENARQTFCKLIDRNVEGMTVDRHRTLLSSSALLSVRTLQNLLRGAASRIPEDKEELVEVYLSLFHASSSSSSPAIAAPKTKGKRTAAPALTQDDAEQATPSPPKRARRTPMKATQPSASNAAHTAPAPTVAAKKSPKAAPARPSSARPSSARPSSASARPAPPGAKESKAAAAARVQMEEGLEFDLERGRFRVGKVLADGADSKVYTGECIGGKHAGTPVAIKVQPRHCKTVFQITTEHHILQKLHALSDPALLAQVPIAYGCYQDACYVLVTNLLGPTLLKLIPAKGGAVSASNALLAALQGVSVLQRVHAAGYVHRDVKPENFAVSRVGSGGQLHLIDFGTAEALCDRNGKRKTQGQALEGTLPYMATGTHDRAPLGKRDDLEGLLWTVLRLHKGSLPWENLTLKQSSQMRAQKSEWLAGSGDASGLDAKVKTALMGWAKHLKTLGPEDEPNYEALKALARKGLSTQAYSWP